MQLNHRELRAFLAIARSGTINAAAQAVGMTQPALSRSLKRLEATLQARLFDRHPGGMALTEFGRLVLQHAELMEFETARLTEEIRMLNGTATGFVRVGIVPSAISSLLRQALCDVFEVAPDVQVQIVEGAGNQMLDAVANGRVDFAVIGQVQSDIQDGVVTTPIGSEEVCVAARPDHPVFSHPALSFADLAAYRWILPRKGNAIWIGFNNMFRSQGLEPPTPHVATNSVHTLKTIVSQDDYLTMMSRVIFSLEERNGLILPIPLRQAHWRRDILLARRSQRSLLPATRLLLSAFEKQARAVIAGAEGAVHPPSA
ncbi:LysR family transcriptional regulator [Sulfitobacter sp. HNIBRBA3233]|uniref:LysR family transcriptional regulator n=1 Tax=Sulfitobacter marinivivus TaxID=3158558 RepID=UPI0032DFCB56